MGLLTVYEKEGVKLEQFPGYSLEDLKRDLQQSNDNRDNGTSKELEYSGDPIFCVWQNGYEAELYLTMNEDETEIGRPQIKIFKTEDNNYSEVFWEDFDLQEKLSFEQLFIELTYAMECVVKAEREYVLDESCEVA